ncbi:hypothetical protein EI534_01895 [Pseudomonas frederiksbergensis]|nr:hypothetical protein [Pseudomonas frederiksbergensis]
MSLFETLTLLISVLAIVVSTVSLVRTRKISEEQLKLEKVTAELSARQIQEIEEQKSLKNKASMHVRINKLGDGSEFVIANNGQGSAYDVDFELIDCDHNPLYDVKNRLPHPVLKSRSVIKLKAAFHMGSDVKYQAKVSWRNEEGAVQDEIFWVSR